MASGSGSGSGEGAGGSGEGASGSGCGAGGWDSEASRQIREQIRAYTSAEINRLMREALQQQQPAVPRPIQHRAAVPRDHVAAHQRLFEDYFAPQPRFGDNFFRRRFRMRRDLFMRIVNALSRRYKYFRFREDASGRPGHSPIQKCTAAIRQLAYGGAADMFGEYLHIGETTARDCLEYFCQGVIQIFGETYLRKPTPQDCQDLMAMHGSQHGFSGMLGSIDCMHWEWKNLPHRLEGALHDRLQRQESHDDPRSRGQVPTLDLTCIFWGSRVEQRHQRAPVVAPFQRAVPGRWSCHQFCRQRQPASYGLLFDG